MIDQVQMRPGQPIRPLAAKPAHAVPGGKGEMTERTRSAGNERPRRDDHSRWSAVLARRRTTSDPFVYAVTTTGIYCRPTCPSRRPARGHVRFFDTPAAARHAGFRPCRRCRPQDDGEAPDIVEIVRSASRYIAANADRALPLRALAQRAGVSPAHFQRQFKKHVGLSPREYQAAWRADRFRRELRGGRDVTSALYEAGYGSPSRVYESAPTGPGMPPATYRRGGAGARIGYVTVECDLGWLLIAATAAGVCSVKLGDTASSVTADLRREFPAADIVERQLVSPEWVSAILAQLGGQGGQTALPLDIIGTAFQWRVWRALQQIAPGETRSYAEVAREIGAPAAVRAVAGACAANPVCLVVPCHRVVPKTGRPGGYRWGASRKARLLDAEAGRAHSAPPGTRKAK
jgi:AraC family transcriptional regulator of adaptative response/methylated-DNA-[protein]-cysteine methyltransferase